MLELGCALGDNLIPMAERHPDSTFVGLDYSRRQIAMARQASAALELTNIEWIDAGIGDVDARLGALDYIICHGVFSWVPRDVQEQIFEVCRARLNPQGVALRQFSTRIRLHLRGVVRDLLRGCAAASEPARRRGRTGT